MSHDVRDVLSEAAHGSTAQRWRHDRPSVGDLTLALIREKHKAEESYTPAQSVASLLDWLAKLPNFDDESAMEYQPGLDWRLTVLRNSAAREPGGAPYLDGLIAAVAAAVTAIERAQALSADNVREALALVNLELAALLAD